MSELLNPTIPNAVNAIEIDAVVLDLQTKLDVNLSWLTHSYARAYRHVKLNESKSIYFPEVYIGVKAGVPSYYRPTPDDTKKGMCYFIVGREENEFEQNSQNLLTWNLSIVFWVNLKLINELVLETELFTQNLIKEVRDVLTNKTLGSNYRLNIQNVEREFREVYKEFTLEESRNYLMAPYQAFRFNCDVKMFEECTNESVSTCDVLLQNISQNEILTCLLPTLNFQDLNVFNSLTNQQKMDINTQLGN